MKRRRMKEAARSPVPWVKERQDAIKDLEAKKALLDKEIERLEDSFLKEVVAFGLPDVKTSGFFENGPYACPDVRNELALCVYDTYPEPADADDEEYQDEKCLFCATTRDRR